MRKKILIIGGTRYFGRLLVQRLIDAGHDVTIATRGKTPDSFGNQVSRLSLDRQQGHTMLNAFGRVEFDIVYDQICYTPVDAAIATEVFAGRIGRYIMASTIEVYADAKNTDSSALKESLIDLNNERADTTLPWNNPEWAEHHYGMGKRQAEAHFHQTATFPFVSVRIAHVLHGTNDFTSRLAQHISRVMERTPTPAASTGATSFISADNIAQLLEWVGEQDFLGPVNAADKTSLSAQQLEQRIAKLLGKDRYMGSEHADSTSELPFDYRRDFTLCTDRIMSLGFEPGDAADWLDEVILCQAKPLIAHARTTES